MQGWSWRGAELLERKFGGERHFEEEGWVGSAIVGKGWDGGG